MELSGNLKKKIEQLQSILKNVQELHKRIDLHTRGSWDYVAYSTATVKEFELLYEVLWKFLKLYLEEHLGIGQTIPGPRMVFKESFEREIISAAELTALQDALRSRNEAAHIYLQEIADQVIQKIPDYINMVQGIIDRLC